MFGFDQIGKLSGNVLHEDQSALDNLPRVFKAKFAGLCCFFPSEFVCKEAHQFALIIGVWVLEMIALGFESNQSPSLSIAASCEDEVWVDAAALPTLNAVSFGRCRHIAVPPADGFISIEHHGN